MLSPRTTLIVTIALSFLSNIAHAVDVTDPHYTTSANITTTTDHGLNSTLDGSVGSLNSITNNHIITTGNSGAASGDYGIRLNGQYYEIFNNNTINTTGNSGRGISINELSEVTNSGTITTQGTSSYGIYAYGDDNVITNSGSITTNNTSNSYGIYVNTSDNNIVTNSGTINGKDHGMYFVGDNNQIINSGTIITTDNTAAHGIFVSAASASDASTSNYSTVLNSGTITSSAHGINVKDDYIQITNSNTITSASSSSDYAIINSDNDFATITNSGTLNSDTYGIYNAGTNATINNSGTINGGVYIGAATFNILGGTISKQVNGAGGLGSVNIGSDSVTTTFNQTATFSNLDILTIYDDSVLNAYANISANNIYLQDNATLTLYDGFSISAPISGQNSSSGTIIISGTTFAPNTQIGSATNKIANLNINDGATFSAQNDIYVSDININNGTLKLNGTNNLTLDGNVTGSGSSTLNLGANDQTISGTLTLVSNDNLSLELGDNSGTITSNAANISADTNLNITTNFSSTFIENNSNYTIIDATSGTINAITEDNININGTNSNRVGLLTYSTIADASSLAVNITRLSAAQATSNNNSQNIYNNIFNEVKSNASAELFNFQSYLDHTTLSSSDITFNLNQLAPHSTKALLATNRDIFKNSSQSIQNHLSTTSNGGLWMQAFNSIATQDEAKDDEGYDSELSGFIIGSDKTTSQDNIIGASIAYIKSNINSSTNLKTTNIDSYQISLYDNLTFGKYFLNSIMALTYNEYSSNKTITTLNQKSNAYYDGQAYSAKLNAGFNHQLNSQLQLIPQISTTFIKNHIDSYQEQGAGTLNLSTKQISANFLEIEPSLKLSYVTQPFNFPEFDQITTNFKISYAKNIINDAPTTISNFATQSSSFNTNISNLDNNSLKINTQIIGHHIDNMTFSTSYNFEKRATYQSHSLFFKIRQNF